MTPWQLAKSASEHAEQTALFCFLAKAEQIGFELAIDPKSWQVPVKLASQPKPIPELRWLHAIPNGGSRGDTDKSRAIEGGKMKAEGVKTGVHDICWPFSVRENNSDKYSGLNYCGLYIEMKRRTLKRANDPHHGCSNEQKDFGQFVHDNGFYVTVCYGWEEAANVIRDYYRGTL